MGRPWLTQLKALSHLRMRAGLGVRSALRFLSSTGELQESPEWRHALYEAMFEHNDSVQLIMDTDTGQIIDANAAAARFYGWPIERLRQMNIADINTLPWPVIRASYEQAVAQRRLLFSVKHRLANGSLRDVEARSGRMHFAGRNLLYSVIHDVTERNVLGRRLEQLTSTLKGAVFQYRITAEGLVELVHMSAGIEALVGVSAEELLRRRRLARPDDETMRRHALMVTGSGELELVVHGRRKWVLARAVGTPQPDGSTLFNGVATDITTLKELEQQLEVAREQAQVANRAKSEFLSNMSHEMRTPLNGMLGMTQLVLETPVTEPQRESLETVLASGQTLLFLINDILDLALAEAGTLHFESRLVDVEHLVAEVANAAGPTATEKGLELLVDLAPEVPLQLKTDPTRLRQVLSNLVGNAVKFTTLGAVTLRLFVEGGRLHATVSDTGIGISPERQPHLFQPFTQADASSTRHHGGTGLGLALSRQLMERMGGTLTLLRSSVDGTTFEATLPLEGQSAARHLPRLQTHVAIISPSLLREHLSGQLARAGATVCCLQDPDDLAQPVPDDVSVVLLDAHNPHLVSAWRKRLAGKRVVQLAWWNEPLDADNPTPRLTRPVLPTHLFEALNPGPRVPRPAPPRLSSETGLAVLLAEDNPINAKIVMTMLRREGHSVVHVVDGRAALAAFEAGAFDLVLMDVQMPGLDGLDATRAIRTLEEGRGRRVPVVALTAGVMPEEVERCYAAGIDEVLGKPLNLQQLRATVHALATRPAAS
jgi:PAS domain S-box-containing protein